ncbi:MAG: ATP-grasp domain-containing protein [Myxococcales bacterium]|nr:ATP-grasp domain-containing protein [Myxococcales bacterium]
MRVLFISPHFPADMRHYTRGLTEVGAEVVGVSDVPAGQLPECVRARLADYVQVPSLLAEDEATASIAAAARRLGIDRVECLWEPCVVLAARVRQRLGIAGLGPQAAIGFRDKPIMKQRVLAAGLRVPRFSRIRTHAEAYAAAAAIGYPVCVKPIAGAGSTDTHRVDGPEQLGRVLAAVDHHSEVNLEEFVEGEEFTYDALCVEGEPVFESVAQYHPRPLESRLHGWISPAQVVIRDPYQPALMPGVTLGRRVLRALGMRTGFCHMEWYERPGGEAVFGEIAARSPGGKLVEQICVANEIDLYREWARVVCWHAFEAVPQRRYHVAALFKRAEGEGVVDRVDGVEELRARLGSGLVSLSTLARGEPRHDWRKTRLSDGQVLLRHPDHATCMEMLRFAQRTLRIHARPG